MGAMKPRTLGKYGKQGKHYAVGYEYKYHSYHDAGRIVHRCR